MLVVSRSAFLEVSHKIVGKAMILDSKYKKHTHIIAKDVVGLLLCRRDSKYKTHTSLQRMWLAY